MLVRSIRARLLLLTWAVALSALAVAAVAVTVTYQRERDAVEESLRETTRAISLVVERELAKREAIAWTLAASRTLQRGDWAEFHEVARAAMGDSGDWVVLADGERQLVNSRVPFGSPLALRINAEPLAVDGVRISALRKGPLTGLPVIGVLVPVRLGDGTLANVAVVTEPRRLQSVLDAQRLPAAWIGTVVDQDRRVIARTAEPARWLGAEATPDLRAAIAERREGFLRSRALDGRATTAYHATSPAYGWTFVIAVPDGVLGGSLLRSLLEVGIAAAALLALAGLSSWHVSRRIARPTRMLGDAARALHAGEPVRYAPQDVPEIDEAGLALAEASASIRAAHETMERRVAEALADAERARRHVERSQRLEALGRLTGGVAHDVNNLLAIVANNVFVLQRLQPDGRGQPQIDAIRRAIDSGRALTRKLQALSPARAAHPETIDLVRWLPSAADLLRSSVGKAVALDVSVAPGTAPVRADAAELELALINLVVNANDAMPGGGRIGIVARAASPAECGADGAPSVAVSVADTGEGIPPELVDRVFEPFFTTKETGKGTGLGLSQVYALCTQLGGSVAIASTPGMGTTVTMMLPAAAGPAERADADADADAATAAVARRSGRVLFVEDNADLAASTSAALRSLGYEVTHVDGAKRALASAEARAFDVVLSDVVMPGALDGADLAERLRLAYPRLPVVLLTGYTEEMARVVAAGFKVLLKPCAPEEIADAIDLARARAGDAPPALPAAAPSARSEGQGAEKDAEDQHH